MKKSSYQKLKERITELEKDINTLVFHPKSIDALVIAAKLEHNKAVEQVIWFSSGRHFGETNPDER